MKPLPLLSFAREPVRHRDQAARLQHIQQERRRWLCLQLPAGRLVDDLAALNLHAQDIAVAHLGGDSRTFEHRHPDLKAVAIESAGEALGDDAADLGLLHRLGGYRPPRGLSEVLSRHHDVARLHPGRELGVAGFQHVLEDLRPGFKNHIRPDDPVRGNVVSELPAAAACLHRLPPYLRNCLGSAIEPATAAAATLNAEARYIFASGLPLRPGKFRAWVEIIASLAVIAPML